MGVVVEVEVVVHHGVFGDWGISPVFIVDSWVCAASIPVYGPAAGVETEDPKSVRNSKITGCSVLVVAGCSDVVCYICR